jgi:hypothetical protein
VLGFGSLDFELLAWVKEQRTMNNVQNRQSAIGNR